MCVRYQPEQPSRAYEAANTQDDMDGLDPQGEVSEGFLPRTEERFTLRNLLFPTNTEPTALSGFSVNICTSTLGEETHTWLFVAVCVVCLVS